MGHREVDVAVRQGRGRTYTIVIAVVVFGGDQRQQTVECLGMAAQPFLG